MEKNQNPGMINDLFLKWPTDKKNSFVVGDKTSDIKVTKNAGINGYIINDNDSLYELILKIPEFIEIVMNKKAVIFGGTGFIGTFFAKRLIECEGYDQIYLCDYKTKGNKNYIDSYIFKNEKIKIINIDIREKINLELDTNIDLICNFLQYIESQGMNIMNTSKPILKELRMYVIGQIK